MFLKGELAKPDTMRYVETPKIHLVDELYAGVKGENGKTVDPDKKKMVFGVD